MQQPHVPLVIAGGGERVTLRQVAQYADVANFGPHHWTGSARTLEDVRRKVAALHQHCGALGRDPGSVLLSHMTLPLVLAETKTALTPEGGGEPGMVPNSRHSGEHGRRDSGRGGGLLPGAGGCGMRYFFVTVAPQDEETLRLLAEEVMPRVAA